VILAAAVAAAATLSVGGHSTAQTSTSVAGQLLVASPAIGDPRFARTVIVMARHDHDGAFGIVINRLFGESSLANLMQKLGEKETVAVDGTIRLFAGGPVQPEIGFVVHGADFRVNGTMAINEHLAVTASREILLAIAQGKGPQQSLLAFGYAGWGAGQLEGELKRRDWVIASAEPKLVFEENREKLWDMAYAQRVQDL
jgi:putative transcriptional regulator